MRTIDLRDYVVERWGPWTQDTQAYTATMLRLDNTSDGLTLSGPLRVRVMVQARNLFLFPGTSRLGYQSKDLFCYVLEVPPGQTWSYPGPRRGRRPRWFDELVAEPTAVASRYAATVTATSMGTPGLMGSSTATIGGRSDDNDDDDVHTATAVGPGLTSTETRPAGDRPSPQPPPGVAAPVDISPEVVRPPVRPDVIVPPPPPLLVGTNAGLSVVIRPAGVAGCEDACAPDPCTCGDPCAPKGCGGGCNGSSKPDCGCGCGGGKKDGCGCRGIETLPCDFAVANRPGAGRFFPVGCEPCSPSAVVASPPLQGPALLVAPARGGTVRTRYFTGMFIGREDLETDQRNVRLKRALMTRAMGQGVVWGLGVGLDGDGICVLPGYGVDCCGNDLILSQTYRVEGSSLLRDPAAQAILAIPGPQRLHLVLEYFECPEAPRPIHGDPCATDARCEPSRMRETVRLRLAPPCDVDDSGPIKDFLAEVEQIRGTVAAVGVAAPAPAPAAPLPAPRVPFAVAIDQPIAGAAPALNLQPQVAAEARDDYVLMDLPARVRIRLNAEAGVTFTGAPITQVLTFDPQTKVTQAISSPVGATWSPAVVEWEFDVPSWWWYPPPGNTQDPTPPAMAFDIGPWVMRDQNGVEFRGTTRLDLTPLLWRYYKLTPWGKNPARFPNPIGGALLHSAVLATSVTVTGEQPPTFPCLGEPCGDGTVPLFPTMPPFLHDDPAKPGQAIDGKVILLALLQAYVTGTLTKYRTGTPYAVHSAQANIGSMLGRVAGQLLLARSTAAQQAQLVTALQRLFEAWCRALLYPGPRCLCEPHGAVIGCVTVDGGVIQGVDPWGGRRWVVHYPLLAYWGQQFGIMPPDAIASKLFHLICCLAGIGATRPPTGAPPVLARVPGGIRHEAIPLGRTMLFTGSDPQVSDTLGSMGIQPNRTLRLNPVDFISRVARAIRAPAVAAGAPLVRMSVLGSPDLTVVMPDDDAPPAAAPAAAAAPTPAGARPLDTSISGPVTTRPKAPVPSLLRGFAMTVASRVVDAVALEPAAGGEKPVVERMHKAGIRTVASVLRHDPEKLHAEVLDQEKAIEVAKVLERSERTAQAVAKEVADAVTAYAEAHGLAARVDFADPKIAADLAKQLADRFKKAKIDAPAEGVIAAIVSMSASG
jgi:hypothetical protein